jgi:hypothetical protein
MSEERAFCAIRPCAAAEAEPADDSMTTITNNRIQNLREECILSGKWKYNCEL